MSEFRRIVDGILHDRNFWYLVSTLVTALWVHFVAKDHPEYNDILAVLNGFVTLVALYVVSRGAVEAWHIRRASARAKRLFPMAANTGIYVDPRLPAGRIVVREATVYPAYKCTRVDYQDENQARGQHNVYINTLNEQGEFLNGVPVEYGFPHPDHPDDTRTQRTGDQGVSGQTNFGMYGPGGMCPASGPGPYFFHVVQPGVPSDLIWGPCLPGDHHVNFLLTFVYTTGTPPPNPPPTPPPTKLQQFADSVRAALKVLDG